MHSRLIRRAGVRRGSASCAVSSTAQPDIVSRAAFHRWAARLMNRRITERRAGEEGRS